MVDLDVDLGIGAGDRRGPGGRLRGGRRSRPAPATSTRGRGLPRASTRELDGGYAAGDPPRLDLTGEVDLGEMRVINDDDTEIDDHGPFRFRDGFDRAATNDGETLEAAARPSPRARPARRRRSEPRRVSRGDEARAR